MAIYQATNLEPNRRAIDVTEANNFTCTVNGTSITRRILRIYAIDGSTALYTNDLTLSPALNDKDTLTVEVPANPSPQITNGNQYRWEIETFENATSVVSNAVAFIANARPVVGLTIPNPVPTQSFTFTPTYSQAQGIPVQFSYFRFLNADGSLLLETPRNFSSNLSYTLSGLRDNLSYQVELIGQTQNGVQFNIPLQTFNVDYASPNINIKPTVTQDRNTSIINIAWSSIVIIPGSSTGTFNYIPNFLFQGNSALNLNESSTISWNVNVPNEFYEIIRIQLTSGFTGDLPELINGSDVYRVGYDGTRWYFNNKGAMGFSDAVALSTNPLYIVVRPTDVVIRDVTADTFITITTQ